MKGAGEGGQLLIGSIENNMAQIIHIKVYVKLDRMDQILIIKVTHFHSL